MLINYFIQQHDMTEGAGGGEKEVEQENIHELVSVSHQHCVTEGEGCSIYLKIRTYQPIRALIHPHLPSLIIM